MNQTITENEFGSQENEYKLVYTKENCHWHSLRRSVLIYFS